MNLAQIRQAVNNRTGHAFDQSSLTGFINEVIGDISSRRNWPWLEGVSSFTTTTDDPDYDLPADWMETRSITIDGLPCRPVSIHDGDQYNNFQDLTSFYQYSIEGGQIIFYPTPPEVDVVHRYVKQEPALASDSDVPLMPSQYHNVIANGTAAMVCGRLDDKKVTRLDAQFEAGVRNMYSALSTKGGPNRIRVRNGYPL